MTVIYVHLSRAYNKKNKQNPQNGKQKNLSKKKDLSTYRAKEGLLN